MSGILQNLNAEQVCCVKQTQGPVLVLAGAGSGKTRVLTHRIAYIIENLNVMPYNILAITFTNKAASEMKERLQSMLGDIGGLWVCTIHSMCNRMLRQYAQSLGYDKNFSIYDEEDKTRVLKDIIKRYYDSDDKLLRNVKAAISGAKNEGLSPDECLCCGYFGRNSDIYCNIYSDYEKQLKNNNALDFDDLIIKAYELLKTDSGAREYFQNKFAYIHIDEFQDTNVIQYKLISLLAQKSRNIFAVGDDDQSIYGFRGAEVENIYRFQRDFHDVKIFKLEQNYRSTKKILDIANCVIKNNALRMEKRLWTENGTGVRAERYDGADENDEAHYVYSMIKSLIEYNGYKYSDFAVLIRLNALSRAFEQEFNNYGVPYRVFGGFKFYERKEIKDIIAYLRLIVNPFDSESLLRIINFPKRGIGDSSINLIKETAARHNLSVYEIVINASKYGLPLALIKKCQQFKDIAINLMQYSQDLDMQNFIVKLLEVTGLNNAYNEDTEENYNRRLNIDEFVNSFIEYFSVNKDADLSNYLTSVTLVSDIDSMDDSGVTLATIHSVKGLEFKAVFVCGLDDGLFPVSRAFNEPEGLEEERRLMYVAITRAKERLYFTRAKSKFMYGERNYTLESKFLSEIQQYVPRPGNKYSNAFQRDIYSAGNNYANTDCYIKTPRENKDNKEESIDLSMYKEGSKVIHKVFGKGVIISLKGEGSNAFADIAFPNVGIKTLALKFAPVKLI